MFYVEHEIMKKRISSEYQECLAYFKWAQYHPVLKEYLIKIVNEGKRNAITGYRLQLIGLRAGLPDYYLPISNRNYNGLWIEMKVSKSFNKRNNQDEWIEKLKKIGHYAIYAIGWQEAARVTMDYLEDRI